MRHHGGVTSGVVTAGITAPTGSATTESSDESNSDATRRPDPQWVTPNLRALELARAAAVEEALTPASVGEFMDAFSEDAVAVTLRFAAKDAGYVGWTWSVTLAIVDAEHPTVSEVVMLPGESSLVAPIWLPWNERIRQGDLGVGDILLPIDNDIRLVPAYLQSDDPAVEEVAHELGIGRVRVMSRIGREDTAARWHEGDFGPDSEMAKAAPIVCVQCAFYLPLAGSLGAMFGVCGNEMSPADGRVVDGNYGCGAGSEIVVEAVPSGFGVAIIDETTMDVYANPVDDPPAASAEPDVWADADALNAAATGEADDLLFEPTISSDLPDVSEVAAASIPQASIQAPTEEGKPADETNAADDVAPQAQDESHAALDVESQANEVVDTESLEVHCLEDHS